MDFMVTFMNLWYLIEHNSYFRFMEDQVQENDEKDEEMINKRRFMHVRRIPDK